MFGGVVPATPTGRGQYCATIFGGLSLHGLVHVKPSSSKECSVPPYMYLSPGEVIAVPIEICAAPLYTHLTSATPRWIFDSSRCSTFAKVLFLHDVKKTVYDDALLFLRCASVKGWCYEAYLRLTHSQFFFSEENLSCRTCHV
jgi:hypothetical protein